MRRLVIIAAVCAAPAMAAAGELPLEIEAGIERFCATAPRPTHCQTIAAPRFMEALASDDADLRACAHTSLGDLRKLSNCETALFERRSADYAANLGAPAGTTFETLQLLTMACEAHHSDDLSAAVACVRKLAPELPTLAD